ncbi:hypothetical protein B0J12DRAFT_682882, partial [Macrophomina phaseolina]
MTRSSRYFNYLPEYRLLVCKDCKYAVCLDQVRIHLRGKHHELGPKETTAALADVQREWTDPAKNVSEVYIPARVSQPIAHLPLYEDGLLCQLDSPKCRYICRDMKTLKEHWRVVHHWSLGTKGGSGKQKQERLEARLQTARKEVYCQRFFTQKHGSQFFQVDYVNGSDEEEEENNSGALSAGREGDLIRRLVEQDLQERDRRLSDTCHIYHDKATKTEVSPWLEMTRWPSFFNGLNLPDVSTLAYAADPTEEPLLALLSESLDRLIERAYQSICEDKISVFDQARINSFMAGEPSGMERLPMVKLQKNTFRSYKHLWKRLLCFACRTSRVDQPIQLAHRFTPSQLSQIEAALSLS